MSLATAGLPDDLAALRAFAQACQQELRTTQNAVQIYRLEIEKMTVQIAKLLRMQFGRSSERITAKIEQLEFQLEELEAAEAEAAARSSAQEQPSEVPPQPIKAKPKRKPRPNICRAKMS
jgi:chromosome segregation ATPase